MSIKSQANSQRRLLTKYRLVFTDPILNWREQAKSSFQNDYNLKCALAICHHSKDAQLKGDFGAMLSEVGGLLEGMCELEHAEVLLVAPYDLQSDGEAFGREAGGH